MKSLPNNLKQIRQSEGISKAELARLAKISERTISRIESDMMTGTIETKYRIVKGINSLPDRLKEYTFDDIFPSKKSKSEKDE